MWDRMVMRSLHAFLLYKNNIACNTHSVCSWNPDAVLIRSFIAHHESVEIAGIDLLDLLFGRKNFGLCAKADEVRDVGLLAV